MALPRACLLGRSFLSRGSPARVAGSVFRSSKVAIAIPQRQFTSRSWLLQEAVQDQVGSSQTTGQAEPEIPEAQLRKNARSVTLLNVPKRGGRAMVTSLFKENGIKIVDIEMRMDRFNFYNDRFAFVELANEQQAQKAVELLSGKEMNGSPVTVRQTRSAYVWGPEKFEKPFQPLTIMNDAGITAAVQPIIDHRRLVFKVTPPGWAALDAKIKDRINRNREIVTETLRPFDVESIGQLSPNWGDKGTNPKYLCFVDFKTKGAAEKAIRALNGTTVQGLEIALVPQVLPPWRAYQLGLVDKEKLKMLQDSGLAPPPEDIDEGKYAKGYVQKTRGKKKAKKTE